jgi:guanosine-3',5'-bis(diphosphate) 3'-pyrophosphohydrolase
MTGSPITHETAGFADDTIAIKMEVAERLSMATDVAPERLAIVAAFTDEYWQQLNNTIDDPDSLANITDEKWDESFAEPGTEAALYRLASIKAMLPADNSEKQRNQHNITLENYKKLGLEAAEDTETLRIFGEVVRAKLMNDPQSQVLAWQTLHIWAPAAEVVGLYELKTELEEAAFERLEPEAKQALVDRYQHLGGDEALQAVVEEYKAGVLELSESELDAPDAHLSISGRRKSWYSMWTKLKKKGAESSDLSDFLGLRIVVDSDEGEAKAIEHCYTVADIVSQCFTTEADRDKDYIMNPKPNGYQSLHMTATDYNGVRLEFQVRTKAMHEMSEHSPNVSHMAYDASSKPTPGKYFGRKLARPERIYGWRDRASTEIRRRREAGNTSLRGLEPDKVLVFVPDGNLYQLSDGNTVLDFAFAVHLGRALSLQTVRRRDNIVRFETPVEFADVIQLNYHPNNRLTWARSWGDKVHTSSAKKALRAAEHKKYRAVFIAQAPAMIELEFKRQFKRRLGGQALRGSMVPRLRNLSSEQQEALGARYGLSFEQALVNIGSGSFKPGKAAAYLAALAGATPGNKREPTKQVEKKPPQYYRDHQGRRWEIAVQGMLDCEHHVAGCCKTKLIDPEQSIVAVPSRLAGDLAIHRLGCVNLPPEPDKLLESAWHEAGTPMAETAGAPT